MPGNGAVGRLELHSPIRRNQHGGHHGQTPESGGDHVAHHVAVVVLQRPNKPAFGPDTAGHSVVNESIEVGDAQFFKLRPVGGFILLFKDPFELPVINLGNGILGGEPQILLLGQGVLETGAGKRPNAGFLVVLALPDGGTVYRLDIQRLLRPALPPEGEGGRPRLLRGHVHGLVHVAIGVPGDGDGGLPVLHHGPDTGQDDRGPEGRAVQNSPNGAVGGFPHFGELRVLLHPLAVGCNRGALHRHAQAFGGLSGIHGDLVLCSVPAQQPQVVILGLQVHKRQNQFFLNHSPENTGHLIPVHLHQRGGHLNLFHKNASVNLPAWRNSS